MSSDLLYAAVPVAATIGGGMVAAYRPPGVGFQRAVQHFAAGAVFAAVSVELVFDLLRRDRPVPTAIGFLVGTGLMLLLKAVATRVERARDSLQAFGLIVATGVDVAIDGIVLGIGFAAGARQGRLLTAALTLELVFLGLSVASEIRGGGLRRTRVVGFTAILAGLLIVGVGVGNRLGSVSGSQFVALLAFGAAALLYLVTEELLVEAHEEPEGPLPPALFFLAFLTILIIDMIS